MNQNIISEYSKITDGYCPKDYPGAEEQAQRIQRCSLLKEVQLNYSNSTASIEKSSK